MNIDRKIYKLLSLTYKSDTEFAEFIEKKFGGINYQKDGDSLLHLLVDKENYAVTEIRKCIKKLTSLGIDLNVKDNDGKTFLLKSVDTHQTELAECILKEKKFFSELIDVNSVDNKGNTLIHSILLNHYCNSPHMDIPTLLDILIDNYNFDASKRNNNNDSILDLATASYYKDKLDKKRLDLIATSYYRYNNDEFCELILNTKEEDLINILKEKFIDYSDALFVCQANNPKNDEVVDRTILCIKKLLSIGCGLLFTKNGDTFIEDAISKGYPIRYISQMLELAESFGLNNAIRNAIMTAIIRERVNTSIQDIVQIYVILSKHGYNLLLNVINDLPHESAFIFGVEENLGVSLYTLIRGMGFKIMFNDTLKELGFDIEVVFSNRGLICVLNTITEFNIDNDYQFIQSFCHFIKEKYSMNIVLPKTIDEKDVLLYLREYIKSLLEDKLDRIITLEKVK